MIVQRQPGEVNYWLIAFYQETTRGWMQRFIPGRFKHVSAFGYQPMARTWLFVDSTLDRARMCLLPDGEEAQKALAEWTIGATVLKVAGRPFPPAAQLAFMPFCCTAMVRALVGLKGGALRPDRLYRQLLRENAEIVHDGGPIRAKTAAA